MQFEMVAPTLRYRLTIALFIVAIHCQAQCIKRTELLALFDSCSAKPYDVQVTIISGIIATWTRCRYAKDSSYVNLRLELAKARFRTSDVRGAISDISQVTRIYAGNQPSLTVNDQIKAYYRLGFYWYSLNEYEQAQTALEKAVAIGERSPACNWTAFALSTLAYVNYSTGEYQKAAEYAEEGMFQAKRANDDIAYLETWGEKIKALIALGGEEQANKELALATLTARKTPDADYYLAIFLAHQAKLARIKLNLQTALTYYKEALHINTVNNNKKDVIDNYINISQLYYEMKSYGESLKHYKKALYIAVNPYVRLQILGNTGAVYWQKKQYNTALRYYQAALNAIPIGFTEHSIAKLPTAQSIRIASQKESLLILIQDKADTWLDSAKAANNRQCLHYALDTYKVADRMIDFMRWEHTGQQSKLYWRKKMRGMYERAIETCYRLGDVEQAFRFMEKSRAVMLADQLNELGARRQLSPKQVAEEQRLRQVVGEQQTKIAEIKPDSSVYATMRTALFTKQDSLNAFLKQLEASNPSYYRYKYDTTTTRLLR